MIATNSSGDSLPSEPSLPVTPSSNFSDKWEIKTNFFGLKKWYPSPPSNKWTKDMSDQFYGLEVKDIKECAIECDTFKECDGFMITSYKNVLDCYLGKKDSNFNGSTVGGYTTYYKKPET